MNIGKIVIAMVLLIMWIVFWEIKYLRTAKKFYVMRHQWDGPSRVETIDNLDNIITTSYTGRIAFFFYMEYQVLQGESLLVCVLLPMAYIAIDVALGKRHRKMNNMYLR